MLLEGGRQNSQPKKGSEILNPCSMKGWMKDRWRTMIGVVVVILRNARIYSMYV